MNAFWLFANIFIFLSSLSSAQTPTLNEDGQRIVEVKLKEGTVLTDAMILFPNGTSWLIPLGALSDGLGIAITPFTALGKAEGTILSEHRTFSLNTAPCEVEIARKVEKYPCGLVIGFEEDFYVDISLLQKWLPIDLEFDTFSSSLTVTAREKLPVQEAMERELRAKKLKTNQGPFDPGYPKLETPAATYDGPFIDQQLSLVHSSDKTDLHYDTAATSEILGWSSSFYVRGSEDHLENTQITFAKRDPDSQLLGPLHARSIELMDVTLPGLPIIVGGGFGQGVAISSFPLQTPTDYSAETIQGVLPSGWEVEIYQNETLLDRQTSNESGRYEFKNLSLFYGLNRFRLIFYGPQGQRREEYKTYNIDQNLQRPGQRDFRLAYATLDNNDERLFLQVDQNLLAPITARFTTAKLTPSHDEISRWYHSAALLGTHGSLLGSGTWAFTDFGGQAQEYALQMLLTQFTLGAKHTVLDEFHSDLFPLNGDLTVKRSDTLSMSTVLMSNPALRLTFEGVEDTFSNDSLQRRLVQRTSLLTGLVFWSNELEIYDKPTQSLTGALSANVIFNNKQLRTEASYDRDKMRSLELDLQNKVNESYTLRIGVSHSLEQDVSALSGMLSRRFTDFLLGVTGSLSTEGEYSIGTSVSFSLARSSKQESWQMLNELQSRFGAVSMFVFYDRNRNMVYDDGDSPLPNIPVQSPQREMSGKTDERGVLFLPQLAPYQFIDLTIGLSGLEDPFQKPVQKGFRIRPRPGVTTSLEFAVQTFSEISGSLNYKNRFKKGIPVQLVNQRNEVIATSLAESDGFFNFDYIAPGEYKIQIDPEYLLAKKIKASPQVQFFNAPEEGTSDAGFNFDLK